MMRSLLLAGFLAALPVAALAGDPSTDGPVSAGGFGMNGSDYFGDTHDRMPFTQEAPPHPIGLAEMERFRAARRRPDRVVRQASHRQPVAKRRAPHG